MSDRGDGPGDRDEPTSDDESAAETDATDSTESGPTDTMSHDETPSDSTDTERATETRDDSADGTGAPTDDGTGAPDGASSETTDAGQGGEVDGGETVDSGERGLVTSQRRRYFDYAVLAALGILAFVALVQLYLNASAAIGRWIEPPYRSLFQAAFNLAVLLLAGAGISLQLRRMGSD